MHEKNLDIMNCPLLLQKPLQIIFFLSLFLTELTVHGQISNNDPSLGFIHQKPMKSPEASSFDRYTDIPVSEVTGTPSITVPLLTIQGRALSESMQLSYHASGIKVNQESTWVGLGWDIFVGGRVTMTIMGGHDAYVDQSSLNYDEDDKRRLLSTVPLPELCYYRFGNVCAPLGGLNNCEYDTTYDNKGLVKEIVSKGALQPDIYNASFAGQNVSFYMDPVTGELRFKGEKKNVLIDKLASGWKITDASGIEYFFEETETTHYKEPIDVFFFNMDLTWLLTRVKHPNGDEINYTYENYGRVYPVPPISEAMVYPSPSQQYAGMQATFVDAKYLTEVTTGSTSVQFTLSTRDDLAGDGARKLDAIHVKDLARNTIIRKILFEYTYFDGGYRDGYYRSSWFSATYATPEYIDQVVKKRLKLDRVIVTDPSGSTGEQSSKFSFEYNPTQLPNKFSCAMDHWGYYNGQYNIQSNGPSLVPTLNSLLSEDILTSSQVCDILQQASFVCMQIPLEGAANRSASIALAQAGMLTKITYPTGGYTKFNFETHRSYYNGNTNFIGGGLRIKDIDFFDSDDSKISSTKYTYQIEDNTATSGVYMGKLNYLKVNNVLNSSGQWSPVWTLYSNGDLNETGFTVGYTRVTKEIWDRYTLENNGRIVKSFSLLGSQACWENFSWVVYPQPYIADVPGYTNGNLLNETAYDAKGTLLQEKTYFYSYLDFEAKTASVKAEDNFIGSESDFDAFDYGYVGWDRYNLFFVPIKSYRTVVDSVVQRSFANDAIFRTSQVNEYNDKGQLIETSSKGSDNRISKSVYLRPADMVSNGFTAPYQQMNTKNIIEPIIEERNYIDGQLLTINRTSYKDTLGLYIPDLVQYQFKNTPMEMKTRFLKYSSKGNVLSAKNADNITVTYLWGYNYTFPIAEIKNATYADVVSVLGSTTLSGFNTNPPSDATLRNNLNTLRNHPSMVNAHVTSYTYSPLVGMTSMTDPNGKTTFYEYDSFSRLQFIRDDKNNIVKHFSYHFKH